MGENTPINSGNNNNLLMGIIIVLLVIIAVLAFFVGKNAGQQTNTGTPTTGQQQRDISITFYQDDRCTNCNEDMLIQSLKALPVLSNLEFTVKNFSDEGVADYLQENNITALPAVITNTNSIDPQVNSYLSQIPSGEYSLNVGAQFNPFAERSERGFLFLEEDKLKSVQTGLYTQGAENPEILWIEYSDLGCGACKQFHNSGIVESAFEKYGDIMAQSTVGFLSVGGPSSSKAMNAIECMAEQKSEIHAQAWKHFYETGSYGGSELETFVKDNNLNVELYNTCLKSESM